MFSSLLAMEFVELILRKDFEGDSGLFFFRAKTFEVFLMTGCCLMIASTLIGCFCVGNRMGSVLIIPTADYIIIDGRHGVEAKEALKAIVPNRHVWLRSGKADRSRVQGRPRLNERWHKFMKYLQKRQTEGTGNSLRPWFKFIQKKYTEYIEVADMKFQHEVIYISKNNSKLLPSSNFAPETHP